MNVNKILEFSLIILGVNQFHSIEGCTDLTEIVNMT